MKAGSAIAIYFVIWWVVLFAILPLGVRNAHESGEAVGEGHEPGAPVNPLLVRKAVLTTLVSAVVFGLVYLAVIRDWMGLIPP
jgi:predicted secreted protein